MILIFQMLRRETRLAVIYVFVLLYIFNSFVLDYFQDTLNLFCTCRKDNELCIIVIWTVSFTSMQILILSEIYRYVMGIFFLVVTNLITLLIHKCCEDIVSTKALFNETFFEIQGLFLRRLFSYIYFCRPKHCYFWL